MLLNWRKCNQLHIQSVWSKMVMIGLDRQNTSLITIISFEACRRTGVVQCCTSVCVLTFSSTSVGTTGTSTSRLTVPAEFSDQSAASSRTGPTPARWSVMWVCDSGASEPSCPPLSSWKRKPHLCWRRQLLPLGLWHLTLTLIESACWLPVLSCQRLLPFNSVFSLQKCAPN